MPLSYFVLEPFMIWHEESHGNFNFKLFLDKIKKVVMLVLRDVKLFFQRRPCSGGKGNTKNAPLIWHSRVLRRNFEKYPRNHSPTPPQDRRHLLHMLAAAQHSQRAQGLQHGHRLHEGGGLLRRLRRLPRPRHVLGLRKPRHIRLPQRELQQGVQVYKMK